MSRYHPASQHMTNPSQSIVYGWDTKLGTFFLTVKDTHGTVICAVGNDIPITDVDQFMNLCRQYFMPTNLMRYALSIDQGS